MAVRKIMIILGIIILAGVIVINHSLYKNSIEADENTVIVCVCTGNMRALETGVCEYAGFNRIPLILTDKTLPEQLSGWLEGYVEENNITKIIVAGPVDISQLIKFKLLNVDVDQINGDSIADILVKLAENTQWQTNDTVIITASDPLAGYLGSYMKVPVFVTANNSTYHSADTLDSKYVNYMKEHNITRAVIVGGVSGSIRDQLDVLNITREDLTAQSTSEVSMLVNNKIRSLNYNRNTTRAYYGFYGEIPCVVPLCVKENAMLIEDSSNTGGLNSYLKENNITDIYFTRNSKSDYLMMEEEDYIAPDTIKSMQKDFNINFLTNRRTLDEATGLYDMRIKTSQQIQNRSHDTPGTDNKTFIKSSYPPIISLFNKTQWHDSNNISLNITKNNNTTYTMKWNTIHPYTCYWNNHGTFIIDSDTGYKYIHKKVNNTWQVTYTYNNTTYYNTTWTPNNNNSWTETQENTTYTWYYTGNTWICHDNKTAVYSIES